MQFHNRKKSFTLIEVLLALSIIAVSLFVIMGIFSRVLGAQSSLDHYFKARLLAAELLNTYAQGKRLPNAQPQMNGIRSRYHYTLKPQQKNNPNLETIEVYISFKDKGLDKNYRAAKTFYLIPSGN